MQNHRSKRRIKPKSRQAGQRAKPQAKAPKPKVTPSPEHDALIQATHQFEPASKPGTAFQSGQARRFLAHLQRQHGNRYAQRILALAREAQDGVGAGAEMQALARVVEDEEAGPGDLLREEVQDQQGDPSGQTGRSGMIQAQFHVGPPGDAYEQEADRVAEQVAQNNSVSEAPGSELALLNRLQQKVNSEKGISLLAGLARNQQQTIGRIEANGARVLRVSGLNRNDSQLGELISSAQAQRIQQNKGGGTPLPPAIQQRMSAQFGRDFSDVRVKSDAEAGDLARTLGARAFTNGRDIWLGRGESVNDTRLIAHELTHVVQQGAAPRITTRSLLDRAAPKSDVLNHLQAVLKRDSNNGSLYRQEIRRFVQENGGDKIASLRRKILESPAATDIRQKDKANSVRLAACGGGTKFPTRSTWVQDENVQAARDEDWEAGEGDYLERAGWISWNKDTDEFSVVNRAVGDESGVDPGGPPADNDPEYCVGHYHTHPPLSPDMETARQEQLDNGGGEMYPVAPSGADKNFAKAHKNPGIVQDFTDTTRTATTDYTYGPKRRPKSKKYE